MNRVPPYLIHQYGIDYYVPPTPSDSAGDGKQVRRLFNKNPFCRVVRVRATEPMMDDPAVSARHDRLLFTFTSSWFKPNKQGWSEPDRRDVPG